MPMTSGFTTVCMKVMQGLFVNIFTQALITRTNLPASLKIMTKPAQPSLFEQKKHEAAAVITYLSPGLRFFHQGQFEGRLKRISPHLIRAPKEKVNKDLQKFYNKLLPYIKRGRLQGWEVGTAAMYTCMGWK